MSQAWPQSAAVDRRHAAELVFRAMPRKQIHGSQSKAAGWCHFDHTLPACCGRSYPESDLTRAFQPMLAYIAHVEIAVHMFCVLQEYHVFTWV